ncbi:MAG: hypothetical protein L6R28_15655 [Planctomycetes bacterium]|nr:hypothetical protein [Planctomycetota bacterium]
MAAEEIPNEAPKSLHAGNLAIGLGAAAMVALALFLVWREGRSGRQAAELGPAFQYDLDALKEVDPALIAYHETGRVESGLEHVRGLALAPDGMLWIAGDRAVKRFDAQGHPGGEIAFDEDVRCVAVDGDRLLVGLPRRLIILDTNGVELARGPDLGSDALLSAVAVSGETIYLADSGRRLVLCCDASGKILAEIGARDAERGVPGLIVPSPYLDVAAGDGEVVYVTNPGRHQVESYTRSGDLIGSWGKPAMRVEGFSGCCNPVAFAPLPGGRCVVSEKGLARVKVMDDEGKLLSLVAAPSGFAENAFGIDLAADAAGRVYVLDTGTRAVRIFEPNAAVGGSPAP